MKSIQQELDWLFNIKEKYINIINVRARKYNIDLSQFTGENDYIYLIKDYCDEYTRKAWNYRKIQRKLKQNNDCKLEKSKAKI